MRSFQATTGNSTSAMTAQFASMSERSVTALEEMRRKTAELTREIAATRTELMKPGLDEATTAKLTSALSDQMAKLRAVRGEMRGLGMEAAVNREELRMLTESMGVHLPGAMGTLLARIPQVQEALSSLAGIMPLVFGAALVMPLIEKLPELIAKVREWADVLGGYGENLRKQFQEAAKASDEALVKVGGLTTQSRIASLQMIMDQENARIATMLHTQAIIDQQSKFETLGHIAHAAIGVITGDYGKLGIELSKTLNVTDEIAKIELLRDKQIKEMGELQKTYREELERQHSAASRLTDSLDKMNARLARQRAEMMPITPLIKDMTYWMEQAALSEAKVAAKDELGLWVRSMHGQLPLMTSDLKAANAQLEEMTGISRRLITALVPLDSEMHRLSDTTLQLTDKGFEERNMLQQLDVLLGPAVSQTEQYTAAKLAEAMAHDLVTQAGMKGIEALVGMVAGKRAAAAVEAVYSTAKGIEQVAAALDPFDPNHAEHAASAVQYFSSAVQYGLVAGGVGGGAGAAVGGRAAPTGAAYAGRGIGVAGGAAGQPTAIAGGSMAYQPAGNVRVMVFGESNAALYVSRLINKAATTQNLNIGRRSKMPVYVGR